jgi:outer membrane protein TolC
LFGGLATAQTPMPTLTLNAALDAAQARSATLPAQDAASRAARERAISAGRLPDPVLRLSVDNLPIEGPMRYSLTDDFMTQRSVEWMQTYTATSKREALSVRYEQEAEAALSIRSLQKTKLFIQTAQAWLERYYQEKMLGMLIRQRNEARQVSQAVESAYRNARATQADVLASRAAVAGVEDRMHVVRSDLSNAQALLQRWVGNAATQPLGPLPRIDKTLLNKSQLHQEIAQHSEIAVLDARKRVALAQAEVAKQNKSVDWNWSLMYSKRGSQFGDMVSFGVSIPLQWDQANKQDRELTASLDQVEQIRLENEEMRRGYHYEIQRLLTNWQNNLDRLADYDKTFIPLATERMVAMEAAFRGGKASLAKVLEAQRVITDTQLERLRIERQTAIWWAELEFLTPQTPFPNPRTQR